MSKNEELWEKIKQKLISDAEISSELITTIDTKVLNGSLDQDDWKNLILRSLTISQPNQGDGATDDE